MNLLGASADPAVDAEPGHALPGHESLYAAFFAAARRHDAPAG